MQKRIWLCLNLRLLSFAIENTLLKHKTLPVNYPFPLTDLHRKQQDLSTLQILSLIHIYPGLYAKHYLILFEFAAVIVCHINKLPDVYKRQFLQNTLKLSKLDSLFVNTRFSQYGIQWYGRIDQFCWKWWNFIGNLQLFYSTSFELNGFRADVKLFSSQ